nr:DNA-binding protein [Rhodoferax sp.]
MKKIRTPAEAKAWLQFQGISVSQWCRENGCNQSLVYEILAGRKKCHRGMSHNIAVKLGIKAGVITTRPGRVSPGARGAASLAGAAA